MKRAVAGLTCAIVFALLAPGRALACIPRLDQSAADREAEQLAVQTDAWLGASSVFIAEIIAFGPSTTQDLRQDTSPGGPVREVILTPRAVLKGGPARTTLTVTLPQRPSCAPSDIALGHLSDLFVVYAGSQGATARSGMIALEKIRHPETLAASSGFGASLAR
jgi:hypothetical protein